MSNDFNVEFIANRPWLNAESPHRPQPISKVIPEWYREADRFYKDPNTQEFYVGSDGGKVPTWKACPAIFDMFITGYAYLTPCDIEFFINDQGKIDCKIEDPNCQDFCTPRVPLEGFYQPDGYYLDHFAWFPDWAVKLPEGYSALYISPSNNFGLPFIMTEGVIDNDNINLPGSFPFFIKEGFTGVIPAGTPFAQIIPFKREDWTSSYTVDTHEVMYNNNVENSKKYRVPDGGVYKNEVWQKRTYS
jgi:hypothetical protein